MVAADDDELARAGLAALQDLGAPAAASAAGRQLRERGLQGLSRGPRTATARTPYGLTARQLEVLGLLAGGLRNSEIAARMVLSERTVDHHVSAVLAKLACRPARRRRPWPCATGSSPMAETAHGTTSVAVVPFVVHEIRRYPVKSMAGESLPTVEVDARGLVGDRWYAVVDGDGKLSSGKHSTALPPARRGLRLRLPYDGGGRPGHRPRR